MPSTSPLVTTEFAPITIGEWERHRFELSDYFSDPDGDELTYSLKNAPDFVNINGQGRMIVYPELNETSTAVDEGTHSYTVVASDGTSSTEMDVTVTVENRFGPEPENATSATQNDTTSAPGAPLVTTELAPITIGEWERHRFELSDYFSDPDGDELTYSLKNAPDFVNVNGQGRMIVYPELNETATAIDEGTHSYTVVASDGTSSTEMDVTVNVENRFGPEPDGTTSNSSEPETSQATEDSSAPGAPIITSQFGSITVGEWERTRYELSEYFSDPDGDELTFSLKNAPDFINVNGQGRMIVYPELNETATAVDEGTHSYTVVASDGTSSTEMDVTVNVENRFGPEPDGTTASDSDSGSATTDKTQGDTSSTDSGSDSSFSGTPNELVAKKGILTSGTIGAQEWGDDVALIGYDAYGDLSEVVWDPSEFGHKEPGFGVAGKGSRWDTQIDYSEWDGGPRSEKLVIDFNGNVTDVLLKTGMWGLTEGGDNQMETGLWRAYDDGKLVGKGLLGPDQSIYGFDRRGDPIKEDDTYGTYPSDIDPGVAFDRLELEATQFEHGSGDSFDRPYGENSSDFNLLGVEYTRTEPADDFLF